MQRRLYDTAVAQALAVTERDVVPDFVLRAGMRYLLAQRARETAVAGEEYHARLQAFRDELAGMPVAVQTAAANEQHYELPTDYFLAVLGPHRKYSSCLYEHPNATLAEAEEAMLELSCQRAQLEDGQRVLELGCGWGSWSLFMAAKYPGSSITAVSNSRTQRAHITAEAEKRGLKNLQVITADLLVFEAPEAGSYDRVVSIECFEHMKNYSELFRRISVWLRPGGLLFFHIFVRCRGLPYHFEVQSEDDWMAKYFFSGGTMPSIELMLLFQEHLVAKRHWYINGTHYSRTLEDWLKLHDRSRRSVMPLFEATYGKHQALKWWVYWRLFYLACSELFAFNGGNDWGVAHMLFEKPARSG
ncbi:cyclopropane-fatty-acyl-phospholipid synthase [Micractinium conductrix]|uniref:Cyclopropane-fatty-acyl-phospholipid synthase n=1 Tax=Micractinium conductrix TaxID=554055 RepID=A0A2P6VLP6_9CHLO|nr:cyclopropane-fatty-acyl-phospholipid synthase [Micractinium conductrix]|eukprot:PSC74985.1 cyclopropane-fatty-acyl-phospholipid synthase [Micractinium conductrix]